MSISTFTLMMPFSTIALKWAVKELKNCEDIVFVRLCKEFLPRFNSMWNYLNQEFSMVFFLNWKCIWRSIQDYSWLGSLTNNSKINPKNPIGNSDYNPKIEILDQFWVFCLIEACSSLPIEQINIFNWINKNWKYNQQGGHKNLQQCKTSTSAILLKVDNDSKS